MALPQWFRSFFNPRTAKTIRKRANRLHSKLEQLEDRVTPVADPLLPLPDFSQEAALVTPLPSSLVNFTDESPALAAGFTLQSSASPLRKVGPILESIVNQHASFVATNAAGAFSPSNDEPLIADPNGLFIDAIASGSAADLKTDLLGLGMERPSVYGQYVSGWVPYTSLESIAYLPTLQFATPVIRPISSTGSVSNQADNAMVTDGVRQFLGFDGTGVSIGVLSDSFDTGPGSYATDVSTGDLPTGINVIDEYSFTGSDEGRAMLQLIHDVAPGASLSFATAFEGEASFANNIQKLANAGADVIVDDVFYFTEPMFMDGVVAQAVDNVTNNNGVTYFSSAGNQARQSYESNFVPSGEYINFFGSYTSQFHDFNPTAAVDTRQLVYIPVGGTVQIAYQWANPYYSLAPSSGGATADLDI